MKKVVFIVLIGVFCISLFGCNINNRQIINKDLETNLKQFLEDKNYEIISSDGIVESYVLEDNKLIGPHYGIIWGTQKLNVDDYFGKNIDTYGFIIKGHKLDKFGDKDQTKVYLLVYKENIIGGYSFPDSDERLVGSVYSLEGMTLEEVVGMDFQTWREEWESKYKE